MSEQMETAQKSLTVIKEQLDLCARNAIHEVEQSERLLAAGFISEAAVRVGRALEAALYAVGNSQGIDLCQMVKELDVVQQAVRTAEASLLANRKEKAKSSLIDCAKHLAKAISVASSDKPGPTVVTADRPRSPIDLLDAVFQSTEDDDIKKQFGICKGQLDSVMKMRNSGAHASMDGERQEVDFDTFLAHLLPATNVLSPMAAIVTRQTEWPGVPDEAEPDPVA